MSTYSELESISVLKKHLVTLKNENFKKKNVLRGSGDICVSNPMRRAPLWSPSRRCRGVGSCNSCWTGRWLEVIVGVGGGRVDVGLKVVELIYIVIYALIMFRAGPLNSGLFSPTTTATWHHNLDTSPLRLTSSLAPPYAILTYQCPPPTMRLFSFLQGEVLIYFFRVFFNTN